MFKYNKNLIQEVRSFRTQGKTYGEIQQLLKRKFPKSTLSEWCKNVSLPSNYAERISKINLSNLGKARSTAVEINKIKREEFFDQINSINMPIALKIHDNDTAKIALSMLCLGEASKYGNGSAFSLGNSDHRIITLFIELLKICLSTFDSKKIRCTVQCRADQDVEKLEGYWQKITKIQKSQFYKTRIDPRTIGKPTKRKGYCGVLRVDYFDRKIQHELESLAQLVYNQVQEGPVV